MPAKDESKESAKYLLYDTRAGKPGALVPG